MDYVLPWPGSHSMGGWTGCPASADSPPRPLGERTPRAPWFSRLDHWKCRGCFPHQHHTAVCERKRTIKKKRKIKKKVKRVSRQVGEGGSGCWTSKEEADAATIVARLRHCITGNHNACTVGEKAGVKKIKKEPWECSCAADLPFKKILG